MVSQTLNWFSAIQDTGVTSAAVPVKKHPTKLGNSVGLIFLSCTFIFFDFAIPITVLLVIPSKKESGIGVWSSPFLSVSYTHLRAHETR